jgi:hypothetical protein
MSHTSYKTYSVGIAAMSLCCWLSASHADDIRTLGGKNYSGTIKSIDATELAVDTKDAGVVKLPMAQVLAVDRTKIKDPGNVKYTEVRLQDESVFRAEKVEFLGKEVKLKLLSGAEVKVPFDAITLIMQDASNPAFKKTWTDILAKKIKSDRMVLLRGEDLIEFNGTFGDVDAKAQTVLFKADGKTDLNPSVDKLHGWIFYHTNVLAAAPICKAYDTGGNEIAATKVTSDGTDLTLETVYKATHKLKLADVARFDFNMGKLYYLSDLSPEKVVERSGAGLVVKYRKDTNLDGEPIVLEKQYAKGLSMHAHTELEYNLAGKYKEFKAIAGVDKRTGDQSQAVISIYCDGERRYSETITAKETKAIGVNLKDVNTLKIVVSSRNFLDLHDHATLAEAKISQ